MTIGLSIFQHRMRKVLLRIADDMGADTLEEGIRCLALERATSAELAERYGVSKHTVQRWFKDTGIDRRPLTYQLMSEKRQGQVRTPFCHERRVEKYGLRLVTTGELFRDHMQAQGIPCPSPRYYSVMRKMKREGLLAGGYNALRESP